MNNITFVYFDLGGVVIDHISSLGIIADHLAIERETLVTFFKKHANDLDRGNLSWDAFEEMIYKEYIAEKRLEKQLSAFFVDNFEMIEETHQLMHRISQKMNIGILSNVAEDVYELIQARKIIPNIEYHSIIVSAKIGSIKPEKEIFDFAIKEAGHKPNEVLFIDDSESNVMAARSFGWNAVQFDTNNPEKSVLLIEEEILL